MEKSGKKATFFYNFSSNVGKFEKICGKATFFYNFLFKIGDKLKNEKK